MLKYLLTGVVCFIGYCFISGHYNAVEAKKYREQKYKENINNNPPPFWPQEIKSRVVTYPKVNHHAKYNTSTNLKEGQKWIDTISSLTQTAFLWAKDQSANVYLMCSNINIQTTTTSKSPFIDIFSQNSKQTASTSSTKVTRERLEQRTTKPKQRVAHQVKRTTVPLTTVPLEIAKQPSTVPMQTVTLSKEIETDFPIPVVTDSNNIEVYQSVPQVPRASMSYTIVSYDR